MNAVIYAHAKVGDKNGAIEYFNMMQDELELSPDVTTITSIIDIHAKAKDKDGAIKYLDIMINELYLKPDLLTMNSVNKSTF